MTDSYLFFVGIDLGSEHHQVHVINSDGGTVAEQRVEHGGAALLDFVNWLGATTAVAAQQVAVATEAPRGAIIDALLERGYAVFSINPKQLDRFRDRFSMAGAKDDRRDALVLAHSVRSDRRHFRRLQPDDPRVLRLRELSRGEEDLREDLRRTANRLWTYLQRYFPALLAFSAADEPWVWKLLKNCRALPSRAAKLRPETLQQMLRSQGIRRLSGEELAAALRQPLPLAPGVESALAEQVLTVLPRLELLHQQMRQITAHIDALIDELAQDENFPEHRSVTILRSVAGVGRVCTATVLAEGYQPLVAKDYLALRALAGVAPVTQQSGKTRIVSMRYACQNRLRHAVFHAANVHMQNDPRARAIYLRLRQKGKSHGRAIRGVADRLLELICILLQKQTAYDPARRALKVDVAQP